MLAFLSKKMADTINESIEDDYVKNDDVLIDEQTMIDHFGILYANRPEKFRFEDGDKCLINELVSYVANVVDKDGPNAGLSQFKPKKTNKVNHTTKQSEQKNKRRLSIDKVNLGELKSELIQRVMNCMQSYKANNVFGLDLENEIHDGIVRLHIQNGTVQCVICDKDNTSENVPKRVHYSSSSDWPCWVLSNFTKHLKNSHHLKFHKPDAKPNKNKKKNKVKCSKIKLEPKSNECSKVNEKNDVSKVDESIVCLNDSVRTTCTLSENKELTHLVYNQLSAQITLMMSVVLKYSESEERMHINLNINSTKNSAMPLTVAKIPGDGNCLYSSLAHQLENRRISGKSHQ